MAKIFSSIKRNINRDLLVIISIFALVFLFLITTKTIMSGYHFIDDHTMISIKEMINSNSFIKVLLDFARNDFAIRFRPLFSIYLVTLVQVFGLNLVMMSIFEALLASTTISVFYLSARNLKFPKYLSIIFISIIFLGSQSSIWWRLGTNETIAVFFLGLAFLFMTLCVKESNYNKFNLLFLISLTLASLCKESFIIIVPAIVLMKVMTERKAFGGMRESLKKNVLSLIPLAVSLFELLIIKLFIGTNKIGYAGVTSSLKEFELGVKNIVFNPHSLYYYFLLCFLLTLIYSTSIIIEGKGTNFSVTKGAKRILIFMAVPALIIIPQIIMHAKSGLVERYLLPTTIGFSLYAITILQNTRVKALKIIATAIVFLFLLTNFSIARKNAASFAETGLEANKLLVTVKDNTVSGSKILLVVDPVDQFEISDSIKDYLFYYERKNLYVFPIMRVYTNDFELSLRDQWSIWFKDRNLKDMGADPDLIVVYDKSKEEDFFAKSKISRSNYKKVLDSSEGHVIYLKEKVSSN